MIRGRHLFPKQLADRTWLGDRFAWLMSSWSIDENVVMDLLKLWLGGLTDGREVWQAPGHGYLRIDR